MHFVLIFISFLLSHDRNVFFPQKCQFSILYIFILYVIFIYRFKIMTLSKRWAPPDVYVQQFKATNAGQ